MEFNSIKNSPPKRNFLPANFKLSAWEDVKQFFTELEERPINSTEDLEKWMLDRNELDTAMMEDYRWRYIKMSCNSQDESFNDSYTLFLKEITPKCIPFQNSLNLKLIESPFLNSLDQEKYFIYLRSIKKEIELYSEKNVEIFTQVKVAAQKFGEIASQMTIEFKGKELTFQQAGAFLESPDRAVREEIFTKVSKRRFENKEELDTLFTTLYDLRMESSKNAGFQNFRDYKFADLGRFDYSPVDCIQFHKAVATEIMPLIENTMKIRKEVLGLEQLRPWDLSIDTSGATSLKPFETEDELIDKSIECLANTHPLFGECLQTMQEMNRLDLFSRKGKRPGGYNMPLPESGVPFVFMNAAKTFKDMRVMMHECGHAVHAFLVNDLELTSFKRPPSEVAELAAMAMELMTMDNWGAFFKDENELRRARYLQLDRVLDLLPWIATVDKFQHWVYTNPGHTIAERDTAWIAILDEYTSDLVDWEGFEETRTKLWHRQLHIFELPFYYIEYGFAQLGAIAIWKQYCENPDLAIQNYINALKLGYTKTIGEIYEEAGIKFDFSSTYIRELAAFIQGKMKEYLD